MAKITDTAALWTNEEREAKTRELFDTVNRVQFAEHFEARSLDFQIALNTAETVRSVYFEQAERTWGDFQHELASASQAQIQAMLEHFKEREAELGDWKPKTLLDHLREGGLTPGFGDAGPAAKDQPPLRDATRNLVESIMLDVWPRGAAVVDFGIDSQEHYEALYYPVREGEITAQELEAALGKGDRLTILARSAPSNPHRDIEFRTSWDEMGLAQSGVERTPSPGDIASDDRPHAPENGNGGEKPRKR